MNGESQKAYRPRQQRKQQHRRNDIRSGKACLILETKRAIKPLLTRQPRDRGERDNTRRRWKRRAISATWRFCNGQFHARARIPVPAR